MAMFNQTQRDIAFLGERSASLCVVISSRRTANLGFSSAFLEGGLNPKGSTASFSVYFSSDSPTRRLECLDGASLFCFPCFYIPESLSTLSTGFSFDLCLELNLKPEVGLLACFPDPPQNCSQRATQNLETEKEATQYRKNGRCLSLTPTIR